MIYVMQRSKPLKYKRPTIADYAYEAFGPHKFGTDTFLEKYKAIMTPEELLGEKPESNLNKLIQVQGPSFTAGLEIKSGVVIRAAPIIKYMKGWPERKAAEYCRKRQWKTISVTET